MILELHSPLDMHIHLREGEMLQTVAPFTAQSFAGGVIMPNLINPVNSIERVQQYRKEITSCVSLADFTPFMTLFFKNYDRKTLVQAKEHIIGVKLYPAGITTRSEAGVTDFDAIGETLTIMQELQIPLLVHGESNGFVMEREREFLETYSWLATHFPQLHIIMEHITTADAVEFLDKYTNVSATVTLHHLMITLDDVVGSLMEPDLFCKPIAKTPRDLQCLKQAVFSAHPRLMFGSDSAPHPRHAKECCGCAAGIFSAPVALPMLAELFENEDKLELLQGFISDIACKRYKLSPPEKTVRLERKNWKVPENYGEVKSFLSGKTLRWSLASHE